MKYKMAGPYAPMTFEEWIEAYEERGCKFVSQPEDHIAYHSEHVFFAYRIDTSDMTLLITDMCGDMKYWKPVMIELARTLGMRSAYYCTRRNPAAWIRAHGGSIRKVELTHDFVTGKSCTRWYMTVTWKDVKE